jgi:PII-like signaling protein
MEAARMLMIFFDESDTWGDPRIPLYEAVVRVLLEEGIAGATVLRGVLGYGAAHKLTQDALFGSTADRPVAVLSIDREDKLRAVLPKLQPMITEGLVFLAGGEVLHWAGGRAAE